MTALQILIKKVQDFQILAMSEKDTELTRVYKTAYGPVEALANDLLTTERKQIEEAVDGFPISARSLNGTDYYDRVYSQQGKEEGK